MLGFREDRQTLRPMDETAPGPLQDDTDRGHRGAYPSTAAVPPRCLASLVLVVAAALAVTDTYDGYERCSLTDLMDMYTCMSDNSYQYHTVPVVLPIVLVTSIIISRRIDRGISNWTVSSAPAVRIIRAVWVMGRIVWTPPRVTNPVKYRSGIEPVLLLGLPYSFLRLRLRQSIRLCTLYRPTST